MLKLLAERKLMLYTLEKEQLAQGQPTTSKDRDTDYGIEPILNAPGITQK